MLRIVLLVLIALPLAGCYYLQAARGQWELTRKREPIADILDDETTSPLLAERLRLVQEARQFSIDKLALPDNDTYRTYADIERDFVVWSVVEEIALTVEDIQYLNANGADALPGTG